MYRLLPIFTLIFSLVAVTQAAEAGQGTEKLKRWGSFAQVTRGARLFQANCATCHGKQAQGAASWKQAGPDGKYPPPPLNGKGHAWHHPLKVLFQTIKFGSPGVQGNMPAWGRKRSDEGIIAIIAWIKQRLTDEVPNG